MRFTQKVTMRITLLALLGLLLSANSFSQFGNSVGSSGGSSGRGSSSGSSSGQTVGSSAESSAVSPNSLPFGTTPVPSANPYSIPVNPRPNKLIPPRPEVSIVPNLPTLPDITFRDPRISAPSEWKNIDKFARVRPELPSDWIPKFFPTDNIRLPEKNPSVIATPKISIKRRREIENRGQDDVGDVPAVQAQVASAGGPKFGPVAPAWKGSDANSLTFCNQSLRNLRKADRINTFQVPTTDTSFRAERDFFVHCLSPLSSELETRTARLLVDGLPSCTVFLITAKRGLTARHCLFSISKNISTGQELLSPAFTQESVLLVETGEIARGDSRRVVAVFVPLIQRGLTKIELKGRFPLINLFEPEGDLIGIELETDLVRSPLPVPEWTDLRVNDKIVLPAFHYGAYVEDRPNESGLRYQTVGYCQVIQPPKGRCFRHACSTTPGASGAPVLIEREQDGTKVLRLAGIHTSGSPIESGCEGDPGLDNILNFGVALRKMDLQLLVDAK